MFAFPLSLFSVYVFITIISDSRGRVSFLVVCVYYDVYCDVCNFVCRNITLKRLQLGYTRQTFEIGKNYYYFVTLCIFAALS